MARPIVLSNGELHVGLNNYGVVHDFYYPYVGFENHASGDGLRHKVGVWIDGAISWTDSDEWIFSYHYPHTALIGHTTARNERLKLLLEFDDFVDAEMSVFMRNIHVVNLADVERNIRLFTYQAFAIGDSRSNTDTAQYLPDSNAVLHYRGRRAFVISGASHDGEPFDQYTIGLFGIENHEGSYRDAEDGELGNNTVEHGRVDSILRFNLTVAAHSSARVHYWIAAGMSSREALYIHKQVQDDGLHARLHNTAQWWKKWLEPAINASKRMPKQYQDQFVKSAMIVKSHIDKRGAVIASTDSSMLNYSRDAYAYSWPRDGAYAVWPLIRLGYYEEPYRFFEFCRRGLHPGGYLSHKYRADGALGSSWHPYVHGDMVGPPIQEDETALVVFMFVQFYQISNDSSLIRDFYHAMIRPMADFLTDYVDLATGLPKPSYDLWEESYATFTYTAAVTYGALVAASELAQSVGDDEHAVKWRSAADDIQHAAQTHLYNEERGVFYKSMSFVDGKPVYDETIDTSAVYSSFLFGLFGPDSKEVASSIKKVAEVFKTSPENPGLPRYENDPYRRSSSRVTGNWWHICTMWQAQYDIEKGDVDSAYNILDWVTKHAMSSTGMLSEQVNPIDDSYVSPSPLTWSHAEYLSTLIDSIEVNHG
ncbi:glycoside hydrolase family 15 protein [Candidatus Saccharibacteria bacterium]|nr:glycoside hydrolase family 15 protein [Candidatus Saccharibacteria bacterium]